MVLEFRLLCPVLRIMIAWFDFFSVLGALAELCAVAVGLMRVRYKRRLNFIAIHEFNNIKHFLVFLFRRFWYFKLRICQSHFNWPSLTILLRFLNFIHFFLPWILKVKHPRLVILLGWANLNLAASNSIPHICVLSIISALINWINNRLSFLSHKWMWLWTRDVNLLSINRSISKGLILDISLMLQLASTHLWIHEWVSLQGMRWCLILLIWMANFIDILRIN